MSKLKLYYIDNQYVEMLRTLDNKISQTKGERRPFVGTIVVQNIFYYFIPLISPKEKHKRMKNNDDFLLLKNNQQEIVGALNFNNMIPMLDLSKTKNVIFKRLPSTSHSERLYKTLILKQHQAVIQLNKDNMISITAHNMRNKQLSGQLPTSIMKRCVDYKKIDEVLNRNIKERKR